ncbi:hypothetical protein Pan258_56380 [Symmachiella dynata]|nr:hypothetical protein Pan258_56380 [Symmachiella dynata]
MKHGFSGMTPENPKPTACGRIVRVDRQKFPHEFHARRTSFDCLPCSSPPEKGYHRRLVRQFGTGDRQNTAGQASSGTRHLNILRYLNGLVMVSLCSQLP